MPVWNIVCKKVGPVVMHALACVCVCGCGCLIRVLYKIMLSSHELQCYYDTSREMQGHLCKGEVFANECSFCWQKHSI